MRPGGCSWICGGGRSSCGDGDVDDASTRYVEVDSGLEGMLTERVIFFSGVNTGNSKKNRFALAAEACLRGARDRGHPRRSFTSASYRRGRCHLSRRPPWRHVYVVPAADAYLRRAAAWEGGETKQVAAGKKPRRGFCSFDESSNDLFSAGFSWAWPICVRIRGTESGRWQSFVCPRKSLHVRLIRVSFYLDG